MFTGGSSPQKHSFFLSFFSPSISVFLSPSLFYSLFFVSFSSSLSFFFSHSLTQYLSIALTLGLLHLKFRGGQTHLSCVCIFIPGIHTFTHSAVSLRPSGVPLEGAGCRDGCEFFSRSPLPPHLRGATRPRGERLFPRVPSPPVRARFRPHGNCSLSELAW